MAKKQTVQQNFNANRIKVTDFRRQLAKEAGNTAKLAKLGPMGTLPGGKAAKG